MRRRIRPAKSIGPELRLQRRRFLRNAANRCSKAFSICNLLAAQAKAVKRGPVLGAHRNSPTTDDRHWLPKSIGGPSSLVRALRRRFPRNFATETANLPDAISKDRHADCKARDFFRALKSRVCTVKTPSDHLAQVTSSMSPPRSATKMAPAIQRDLCESHRGRLHR